MNSNPCLINRSFSSRFRLFLCTSPRFLLHNTNHSDYFSVALSRICAIILFFMAMKLNNSCTSKLTEAPPRSQAEFLKFRRRMKWSVNRVSYWLSAIAMQIKQMFRVQNVLSSVFARHWYLYSLRLILFKHNLIRFLWKMPIFDIIWRFTVVSRLEFSSITAFLLQLSKYCYSYLFRQHHTLLMLYHWYDCFVLASDIISTENGQYR